MAVKKTVSLCCDQLDIGVSTCDGKVFDVTTIMDEYPTTGEVDREHIIAFAKDLLELAGEGA